MIHLCFLYVHIRCIVLPNAVKAMRAIRLATAWRSVTVVVVAASGQALICIILDILHVRRQKQLLSSRSHAPVYARNLIKNV